MSYAEVVKLHDLRELRNQVENPGHAEVLRVVLAIVVDPETAAWCLGCPPKAAVSRWPSTLYRLLAESALRSPAVWRRCALLLDRSLQEALVPYEGQSPADLAEVFADGRESLGGDELAALLWCLLRERSRSHDLVAERLGLELEVVAARRLHGS